ncbi:lamin tail domain-containing protein [Rhodohalobacter sp. SW132]|uniref:lamin tail domain-containing protein n=2 Tax=Rhodohalobacter sp. SW132 TaxID=2293433 RepID=UPI001ADFFF6C|nr:lamin tail domain-containing protein [Rhodohalobacter sp. SW132]
MLFCFEHAESQVLVMHETFEDQDLSSNPAWTGDLHDFSFTVENGNTLLQLSANPDPSRTQIATPSAVATGSWEFYIRQEFNPSNLNRAFIFLMADRADLNYLDGSSVNGYAVRTGDNDTPRRMKLVRFDNGNQTVLTESETELQEGGEYRVNVTRSEDGVWQLYLSEGFDSVPAADAEPVTDLVHQSSEYFGLLMRYSSANTEGFYFGDIKIKNSEPFQAVSAGVVRADQVRILFNYPLDPSSVSPQNIQFSGLPAAISAEVSGTEAVISFEDLIEDGSYSVNVENVRSEFGDHVTGSTELGFSFENPLYLSAASVTGEREIELKFSLRLTTASADPGNFLINREIIPLEVDQENDGQVILRFGMDLPPGEIEIEMNRLESEEGWRIRNGTVTDAYRFGEIAGNDVVINEILYRRIDSASPQFVEIYNRTEHRFELSGWQLETGRGSAAIGHGITISGDNFLVITDSPHFAGLDDRILYLDGFVPLRTTGDMVVLRDADGAVIDSLTYTPGWGGNRAGVSLERKDPNAISIDPVNWAESRAENGMTPLEQNSRYRPDIEPPKIIFAGYNSKYGILSARFNKFVKQESRTRFFLDGTPITPITGLPPGSELQFHVSEIPGNREVELRAENLYDYQLNAAEQLIIPVSRPIESGAVVFNEIMFDPLQDDYDGLPNQTEYIELRNRRNVSISLEGIYLHDRFDENGEVSKMHPESTRSAWIPAGGYALLQAGETGETVASDGNAEFFGFSDELAGHILNFNRATLGLPMAGREVYLADSLGAVIDGVDYSPDWHNPNLVDTKGISLERINPNGETNDPSNWGSSTVPAGGTPGRQNSIFQVPEPVSDSRMIHLQPNPFSPDGDGHEDHLFINYRFDDPNYMLRVRIFDRYGRLFRSLADSHPAGFEGALVWDGRSDRGITGRIGIYIIHIEAYNSSTGNRVQMKETAVLARQF